MNDYRIDSIFPTPLYVATRSSNLDLTEEKEIKDIIEEGMHKNVYNTTTNNSYIFDTKLKKIKEFCKEHINTYLEKLISPEKEIDLYITQSWINVNKPGESHHLHNHPNSIISGVYYVATGEPEEDRIHFHDPTTHMKERMEFDIKEYNFWNSTTWFIPVEKNNLILFPSWLPHSVEKNENATIDRISISFNTFVRGKLGEKNHLNELII